jgi:hypothetical protein
MYSNTGKGLIDLFSTNLYTCMIRSLGPLEVIVKKSVHVPPVCTMYYLN